MRILLEAAENPDLEPQHIVFQPELVARASTR
jgi:DNA-binding LacI/PurR family transcriptional regulator